MGYLIILCIAWFLFRKWVALRAQRDWIRWYLS